MIQLAGCKKFSDCKLGSDFFFWNTINNINCCSEFENLEAYFVSVMRNANVYLGFLANREKLGKYIFKKAGKYIIDPVIDGFIGKKFLAEIDSIDDMPVYKIRIEKNGELIEEDSIEYEEFAKLMKTSKSSKNYITIAAFQTGRVLFSGIHEKYQIPLIEWFLNLIHEVKNDVKIIDTDNNFSLKKYLKPTYSSKIIKYDVKKFF